MNILITGVAGFIGRNLANHLNDSGHHVIGIDVIAPANQVLIAPSIEYRHCDLSVLEQTENSIKDAEIIVHLAGEASVNSTESTYNKNTILGLSNLLKSIDKNSVQKIILLSSEKAVRPSSLYSQSKIRSENMVCEYAEQAELPYTILRSAAVYGAGMKSNIAEWLKRIKNKNLYCIPASNSEISMVGIDDLCRLIIGCIESSQTNNNTYHVTDMYSYNINQIEKSARSAFNLGTDTFCYPKFALFLGSKFGDICTRFGWRFPLNSNAYHMFFNNSVSHDDTIYSDIGIKPKQNFLDEIPTIFAN